MLKKVMVIAGILAVVVSAAQAGNFTEHSNSTVTDNETGLMWQQYTADISGDSDNKVTWKQALMYCESLQLGGYGDWRLPNIKELRSIVNYHEANPASDDVFPDMENNRYWSSTSYPTEGDPEAWTIRFSDGVAMHVDKTAGESNCYVRAVRGKPAE